MAGSGKAEGRRRSVVGFICGLFGMPDPESAFGASVSVIRLSDRYGPAGPELLFRRYGGMLRAD